MKSQPDDGSDVAARFNPHVPWEESPVAPMIADDIVPVIKTETVVQSSSGWKTPALTSITPRDQNIVDKIVHKIVGQNIVPPVVKTEKADTGFPSVADYVANARGTVARLSGSDIPTNSANDAVNSTTPVAPFPTNTNGGGETTFTVLSEWTKKDLVIYDGDVEDQCDELIQRYLNKSLHSATHSVTTQNMQSVAAH